MGHALLRSFLIGVLSLASIGVASAQDSFAGDEGRPFYAGGGLGVVARLDGTLPAAFRVVEEFGFHFEGTPVGPFLGLMLAEDIGNYFGLQVAARGGWDIELLRQDFSIVLTPALALGGAFELSSPYGDSAYFLIQPALGASVLLLERTLAIWFRPIVVDVLAGSVSHPAWSVLAGANATF
jgi:hypothetical protein